MMNKVECLRCGTRLPDGHTSACPFCGNEGRARTLGVAEEKNSAPRLTWEKHREYFEKKPFALGSPIAITFGAPFLGLLLIGWQGVLVGLLMGILAFWLGPVAVVKVREIERTR